MIDKFVGEYRFLSNFYEASVIYNGITYRNNEAAFQAQKTLENRERFSNMNPSEAKRAGRRVKLRPDWEEIKFNEMYNIVKAKFIQNHDLLVMLLNTGNEELIEGNNWGDRIWGCVNGVGQNNLGKILMKVREELNQPI